MDKKILYEIANEKLKEIVESFSKKDLSKSGFIASIQRSFECDGRSYELKLSCLNLKKRMK